MSNVRPQTVVNELQSVLDSNIDDPNPDRNGDTRFVYTIPVNHDLADYPRIHLQQISSVHNGFSLGSGSRKGNTLIQISIFHSVHDGYKFDIDDDNENEEINNVVDFLADRVIEEINNNQSIWRGLGDNVHYVLTENETRVDSDQNSVVHYIVEAEAKIIR